MTHDAETISCTETSRNYYRSTQGNIPDERTPQPDGTTLEERTLWWFNIEGNHKKQIN